MRFKIPLSELWDAACLHAVYFKLYHLHMYDSLIISTLDVEERVFIQYVFVSVRMISSSAWR